jgi:hypothetical protein
LNIKRNAVASTTLMEFRREKAAEAMQRGKDRARKTAVKQAQSKNGTAEPGCWLVLVEEDRLFLRLLPSAPAMAAHLFRTAFVSVWDQIPEGDRRCLVTYWQSSQEASRRPLIQVLGVGESSSSEVIFDKLGNAVTFPISLVGAEPHHLQEEIARILAQVYRLATREHWLLIQSLLETPLRRWERQQGARATDAARNKRLDALERTFLRQVEAREDQILERWKIEPPAA